MKPIHTFALSLLLAATSAFSATAVPAPAPAAPASGVMPDLAHPWTPEEFATAADLASTKVPLLTYATPAGKAFFDRLTSMDILSALTDRKVPVKERIHQSSQMVAANGHLLAAYLAAANDSQTLHAEITAGMVLELTFSAQNAILASQFLVTANSQDPKVIALKAHLDTSLSNLCKKALAMMLVAHFQTPKEIAYELQTMSTNIVLMNVFFTPTTRVALRQQLTAMRTQLPDEPSRQLDDKIVAALAG